ncbi:MAG: hypothetical protein HYU36_01890 [Planctomycetes bacterium]|nr:hypothetical protein [Planctomycetota bacterium]
MRQLVRERQAEYLRPGRNAMETSIELAQSFTRKGRPYMLFDSVKKVLKALNDNHIPYAIIGGLAVAHHAVPRLTQDVDVAIFFEDTGKVRDLFPGCYLRGTAVVEVYEIEGTRVDVLPAKLRYQRAAVQNAVAGEIEGVPARICAPRDLLLLKMVAAPNRPELAARMQDEADIAGILQFHSADLRKEDAQYVADRLLELCFTLEERNKTMTQIEWLNGILDQLGMADRKV